MPILYEGSDDPARDLRVIPAANIITRACLALCFVGGMSQYHTIPRWPEGLQRHHFRWKNSLPVGLTPPSCWALLSIPVTPPSCRAYSPFLLGSRSWAYSPFLSGLLSLPLGLYFPFLSLSLPVGLTLPSCRALLSIPVTLPSCRAYSPFLSGLLSRGRE